MKRVFLVHGWGGSPQREWFPWLKKELEDRGFTVAVPALPDTENPQINTWIPALKEAVGIPDAETYFVGHSMGCQTIARYLETLDDSIKIGGVVYVGGYFDSLTLDEDEEEEIWQAWHSVPIDLDRVRQHAPKSIAIFSDNDPYVSLTNKDRFESQLDSKIIIEHNQGHFNGDAYTEIPSALSAVLELAGS
jgi:predicted alpha/beta hydrolase family esterase